MLLTGSVWVFPKKVAPNNHGQSGRKVKEHNVTLREKYLSFLLGNAFGPTDLEIKRLMSFRITK